MKSFYWKMQLNIYFKQRIVLPLLCQYPSSICGVCIRSPYTFHSEVGYNQNKSNGKSLCDQGIQIPKNPCTWLLHVVTLANGFSLCNHHTEKCCILDKHSSANNFSSYIAYIHISPLAFVLPQKGLQEFCPS